jgi:hypothetical protein
MGYRIMARGEVTYTGVGQPRNIATRRFVALAPDRGPAVVIVTEGVSDKGVSITNAIENVRAALIRRLGATLLGPAFALVEHYEHTAISGETFDWVYFTDAGRPIWKPLETGDRSRAAMVRLLGGDEALLATACPPRTVQP